VDVSWINSLANLDFIASLVYGVAMFFAKYLGALFFFIYFHLIFWKVRQEIDLIPFLLLFLPAFLLLIWISIGEAQFDPVFGGLYLLIGVMGIVAGLITPNKEERRAGVL